MKKMYYLVNKKSSLHNYRYCKFFKSLNNFLRKILFKLNFSNNNSETLGQRLQQYITGDRWYLRESPATPLAAVGLLTGVTAHVPLNTIYTATLGWLCES